MAKKTARGSSFLGKSPSAEVPRHFPLLTLVIANMIPLVGVIFFGWDAFNIIVAYFMEALVIGFFNVLRIAVLKEPPPSKHPHEWKLAFVPIYTAFFGGLCTLYGTIIFFVFGESQGIGFPKPGQGWPCFLVFVQIWIDGLRQCLTMRPDMTYALVALFMCHGISYVYDSLIKGENRTQEALQSQLLRQPLSRLLVMHLAVVIGGGLSIELGSPVAILVVLIALKTSIDMKLHVAQHKDARLLPVSRFAGVLFAAVVYSAFLSWPVVDTIGKFRRGHPDWGMVIVLVPFELIGLVLVVILVHRFLALFSPRPMLELSSATVPLGGAAEPRWKMSRGIGRIRRLTVTLCGIEEVTYQVETQKGTGTCTDRNTFYEREVCKTSKADEIAAGSAGFVIPRETMYSFEAEHNRILWSLEVFGKIGRWPDVKESFKLTIVPGEG